MFYQYDIFLGISYFQIKLDPASRYLYYLTPRFNIIYSMPMDQFQSFPIK